MLEFFDPGLVLKELLTLLEFLLDDIFLLLHESIDEVPELRRLPLLILDREPQLFGLLPLGGELKVQLIRLLVGLLQLPLIRETVLLRNVQAILEFSNLLLILMYLLCVVLQLQGDHVNLLIELLLTILQHRNAGHLVLNLLPQLVDQLVLVGFLLGGLLPHGIQLSLDVLIPKIKLLDLLGEFLDDSLFLPDPTL